mgnify:FL=1
MTADAKRAELVPLGVPGLDELLGGGVPRGYIIVVGGYPGAGKTTLAAQFIYRGLQAGEPGLYISFVDTKEDFYRNMAAFGMDFASYESKGLFTYYEALNVSSPDALGDLLEDVLTRVVSTGARRVALDSVSAVVQLARDPARVREILHSAFYVGLKRNGVTAVLISELPVGSQVVGVGPEEFIADGLLVMKYSVNRSILERFIEVRKMRGIELRQVVLPYTIGPAGVEAVPPLSALIARLPSAVKPERRVPAINIAELRVPAGSGVLITYDPTIDPLPISLWALAYPALREGLRVRFGSYIHGVASARHMIEQCPGIERMTERLEIQSFDASAMSPADAEIISLREDALFRPDVVIVEGIHMLLKELGEEGYRQLIYRTLIRRAASRVTTFHLFASEEDDVWSVPLSKYYDYVFHLTVDEEGLVVKPLRVWGSVIPPRPIKVAADHLRGCATLCRHLCGELG